MPRKNKLDKYDYRILEAFQIDGTISNVDLSKKIGLSPPATLMRVRHLKKDDIIQKSRYFPNYDELGFSYNCIVICKCDMRYEDQFLELLKNSPGIVYSVKVSRDSELQLNSNRWNITTISHCAYKTKSQMIRQWSEIVAQVEDHVDFQVYEAHERILATVPVPLEKTLVK